MERDKQEQRGIYNVTFGDEKATPIFKDIEVIEDAVIEYIAMYVKGWHNVRRDKGTGAEHIKLHLEKGSQGEISIEELVNIGKSLREFLKNFDEPFIDKNGAKVYEWQNDNGVRFRVITDKYKGEGHSNTPLSPFADVIITFYSDRNLNKQMEFKNPRVEAYYHQQSQEKPLQKPIQEKKNIFSKNPKPTQETRDKLNKKAKEISNKLKIDKTYTNKPIDKDR